MEHVVYSLRLYEVYGEPWNPRDLNLPVHSVTTNTSIFPLPLAIDCRRFSTILLSYTSTICRLRGGGVIKCFPSPFLAFSTIVFFGYRHRYSWRQEAGPIRPRVKIRPVKLHRIRAKYRNGYNKIAHVIFALRRLSLVISPHVTMAIVEATGVIHVHMYDCCATTHCIEISWALYLRVAVLRSGPQTSRAELNANFVGLFDPSGHSVHRVLYVDNVQVQVVPPC